MKNFKIKIWNYRSIPIDSPVEIEIKGGILFILGINNCGKSNLLRFLYDFRNGFLIQRGVYSKKNNIGIDSFYDHVINRRFSDKGIQFKLYVDEITVSYDVTPNGNNPHTNSVFVTYSISSEEVKFEKDWDLIIDCVNQLQNAMYVGAGRVVLHQTSASYYDVEIGNRFYQLWGQWSAGGDLERMEKIDLLKAELKELFQFSQFEIILEESKSKLFIKTDDGLFDLNSLGSGITHFIFVLANALIKSPSFVLIDEPETGLHPRLQQLFIQALAAKAKIGLIATSHSVGLARSSGDNVLSLTRDKVGRAYLAPFGKHFVPSIGQSITELGYSQYAELGGNSILLVEGRTDIKAFREILRLFRVEHKFIIMSFGGRQFITKDKSKIFDELLELNRFNTQVSVIFDSEYNSSSEVLKDELKAFEECCLQLGFKVFPTEFHSTENYISQMAINSVLGKHKALKLNPFEKFENQWGKEQNWLMFREMNKSDFDSTKLGDFIEDMLTPS